MSVVFFFFNSWVANSVIAQLGKYIMIKLKRKQNLFIYFLENDQTNLFAFFKKNEFHYHYAYFFLLVS